MERYVSFVKEWASDHGLTYMCSIGDPRLKADYAEFKKTGKKPKKSGRASKYQTKEEARLANIAKTAERKRAKKMIQAGTPERMVEAPPPKPTGESALKVLTNPDLLKQIGAFNRPKPKQFPLYGEDIFVGMTEKEKTLVRGMIAYYKEQDDDMERFYREDRNGNPVEIKGAFTALKNEIAKDLNLPKTWLKQGDAVMEKYGMDYGNYKQKTQMIRGKGMFDRGNQMPPSARDYLKKNGDQTITSMRIERIPLGGLQKSLTAIVYVRELLTKFKKPENIPQDDLFHLQMVLTLSNGRRVMWGKEEVIKLSEKIYTGDKMEFRDLGKTNIKLQDFVDKTAKTMGAKFAPYNAFDNNCQDFIMASLKSNGLGTQADYDFVKQDTKDLFKGRQWLIDMMKGATDLASAFNVLIEGKGLEELIPLPPAPNPFLNIPDRATREVLTNSDLRRQIDAYLQPFTPPMEDLKRGPKGRKKFGGV